MATIEYDCSKCGGSLDNATWVCISCGEDYSDNVTEEPEEEDLERGETVFTGWRTVTPGKCFQCGFDNDWHVDGRGNILCGCQACSDCGIIDVYGFHNSGCVQLREEELF